MDLKKETIVITGAAGFVGACLARRLVEEGLRPHVLVHKNSDMWRLADIRPRLVVHEVDLTESAALRQVIGHIRPTIIYHLAAHGAYSSQNDPNRIMAVNVMGTLNLLQALEGIEYKLLVNTGSSSEYGFTMAAMKETDALVPNSYYAVSKVSQSLLCQYAASLQQKNIVTLRLFSIYGPFEEPSRLVPTLIRSCLQGKDLNMVAPHIGRDFIFVEDAVDAYLNTTMLMAHRAGIFNICSGIQSTIKEITDEVIALTQAKVKVNWNAMPNRIWDQPVWVGDPSLARERLSFTARTSLNEGLTKTIAWIKKHG